jgi:hypothetical protein
MGNRGGVVLPFRTSVIAPQAPDDVLRDQSANTAWDEFLHAALRAWSWRDPDTLRALVQAVEQVRPLVERDWPGER